MKENTVNKFHSDGATANPNKKARGTSNVVINKTNIWKDEKGKRHL